jgi:hypothetical protein
MKKIKFIAETVKYWDKSGGYAYRSCRITRVSDGKIIYAQIEGIDNRQQVLRALVQNNWIPKKYRQNAPHGGYTCYSYEHENNYPIYYVEVPGTYKECKQWGEPVKY